MIALVVVAAYLLGSIPSGLLIGRALGGVDIRTTGSGRTGATNAMRSLGARGFVLTFLADALKAVAACAVARLLVGEELGPAVAESVAAIAAIVGHNWSIFIGFGGGRGAACSFGATCWLYWPAAVVGLVAAAILIGTTRYVSLGSMAGILVGAVVLLIVAATAAGAPTLAVFAVAVAALVIFQHRDNIQRLRAGTERRFGKREAT